jgi:hypothetical protein
MNNVVKSLGMMAIFGAGVGAGYLIAKKQLERKYEAIAQEEIDSVKERFLNKASGEGWAGERLLRKYEEEHADDNDEEEEFTKSHDTSKDYTDEVPKEDPFEGMTKEQIEEARAEHKRVITNYAGMYKPSLNDLAAQRIPSKMIEPGVIEEDDPEEPDEYEDAETDEERELREGEALGRVDHEHPYIIEPEQFDTECEHYDKLDLFYYSKDDTLCDDDDAPLEDTEDYDDAIAKLQMQTNVYVRNEAVGADYAIHRLNRSYQEDVLGIAETPKEREYRHLARRKSIMDGEE